MCAETPARVAYVGSQVPVNSVEICATNAAGTSCADRLALQIWRRYAVAVPGQTDGHQARRAVRAGEVICHNALRILALQART